MRAAVQRQRSLQRPVVQRLAGGSSEGLMASAPSKVFFFLFSALEPVRGRQGEADNGGAAGAGAEGRRSECGRRRRVGDAVSGAASPVCQQGRLRLFHHTSRVSGANLT